MCPACLTTLALIATGATSTGGLAALAVNKLRKLTGTTSKPTQFSSKEAGS